MHVGPVIAVTDLARARAFYEDALGLRGEDTPGGWVVHADEGTRAYLLPDVPEAGSATWPWRAFELLGCGRRSGRCAPVASRSWVTSSCRLTWMRTAFR